MGLAVIGGGLLVSNLGRDNNIIQILNMVMYPFAGVLLGIFLLGLLTRRANGWACCWVRSSGFSSPSPRPCRED